MRINQVCQGKPGVMAGCASHMMSQWPLGRNNEGMQWSRPLPVCAELRNLHNFFNVNPWLLKDCELHLAKNGCYRLCMGRPHIHGPFARLECPQASSICYSDWATYPWLQCQWDMIRQSSCRRPRPRRITGAGALGSVAASQMTTALCAP